MERTVVDIIRELKEKGFRLALDGEDLSFSYRKETAPNTVAEFRQKLKQNKDQLVAYLSTQLHTRRQRPVTKVAENRKASVLPIIWETGNITQIRSLLVLREAELVVAKTHLTGDPPQDWYAHNQIVDLEIKIADLRKWLAEAMEKHEH